jgi:hypothetical protein
VISRSYSAHVAEALAEFHYYGISPWEIEVLYDTLNRSYEVNERQLPPDDPKYVSMIEIVFPLPYDEEFFRSFTMESWFKIKGVIKDIKRRRGGKGLKTFIKFEGKPAVVFQLAHKGDRQFEMGVEKLEYLVDVVPIQLKSVPSGTEEVLFIFDETTYKWSPSIARAKDRNYFLKSGEWKTR